MILVIVGQLYHSLRRHLTPLNELHELLQVAPCALAPNTVLADLKLADN